jgi:putative flippase GtrA
LNRVIRFLLVGGSNTAATFVLFVVLQQWLAPAIAYTAAFAAGLAYATAMTARVVFGARLTVRSGLLYCGWYLLVYAAGLLVVQVLHAVWQPADVVTAVLTMGVTAPLGFLGGRFLFAPRPAAPVAGTA